MAESDWKVVVAAEDDEGDDAQTSLPKSSFSPRECEPLFSGSLKGGDEGEEEEDTEQTDENGNILKENQFPVFLNRVPIIPSNVTKMSGIESVENKCSKEGVIQRRRSEDLGGMLVPDDNLQQSPSFPPRQRLIPRQQQQRPVGAPTDASLLPLYDIVVSPSQQTRTKKPKKEKNVRKRIRSRMISEKERDWRDELMQEMFFGDAEPLISPTEIQEIRQTAWRPNGVFLPHLCDLTMGYDTAWDIGKRGCVATKLSGDFDLRIGPNKLRFFVMDGTDKIDFLTYYTKHDILVERGQVSKKMGSICAMDLRDGYWNYRKKKVRISRSNYLKGHTSLRILEGISAHFFDAMLVCLREMEVYDRTQELKATRLAERQRRVDQNLRMAAQRDSSFISSSFRHPSAPSLFAALPPPGYYEKQRCCSALPLDGTTHFPSMPRDIVGPDQSRRAALSLASTSPSMSAPNDVGPYTPLPSPTPLTRIDSVSQLTSSGSSASPGSASPLTTIAHAVTTRPQLDDCS